MKIEHFALNVPDPVNMAEWYQKNLGMKVVRKMCEPPYAHFIADSSGDMMIEIYKNPPDQVPDYNKINPLQIHLAFVSDNPLKDKERLIEAGATYVEEVIPDNGTHLIMMRDPWGIAIQLCKRGHPMLSCQK